MNEKIIEIMQQDIKRCAEHNTNTGSYNLFQTLIAKYNGLFPGFSSDFKFSSRASTIGHEADYRPEINAVKEKLELLIITEQNKDPLFRFKKMLTKDIEILENSLNDKATEEEKKKLYRTITAKYHPYVPKLGEGLYSYFAEQGFYDEVEGSSLDYNLQQIYNKLCAFKALNYPGLDAVATSSPNTVVNITNNNENKNTMNVTFDSVRKTIDSMTSLPEEDIEEIKDKISVLEEIVNSKESKSKKWSKAKDIIKWVADKGVDVGIALLPLILKIG